MSVTSSRTPRVAAVRCAAITAATAVLVACGAMTSIAAASTADQPVTVGAAPPVGIADLMRLRTVSAVDVSEDGRHVVYAVSGPGWRDLGPGETPTAMTEAFVATHLHLAVVAADGSVTRRQLTHGQVADRAPAVDPSGRRVAFLRPGSTSRAWDGRAASAEPDAPSEAPQVWILDLDGGEARQVTWFRAGCGAPRWSPDGARLLVTASVSVDEIDGVPPWIDPRPGAEAVELADAEDDAAGAAVPTGSRAQLRRWLADRSDRSDPRVITRLDFQGERGLAGPVTLRRAAIVDLPTSPGEPSVVRWATRGHVNVGDVTWTADGTGILYTAGLDDSEEPDAVRHRGLFRCGLDGLDVRTRLALDDWTVRGPVVSSAGQVLILAQRLDQPTDRQWQLARIEPGAVGPVRSVDGLRWLADDTFDRSVSSVRAGGGLIHLTAPDRGGIPLFTAGLGLLAPQPVVRERDGLPVGVYAFDAGGETLAWSETSVARPSVLRVRTAAGESIVHDPNPWVAGRSLAVPVRGVLTRPDGLEVEYWTMEPPARRPRAKVPMVLQIHGGPSAMWGPGERSMWLEFQVLAGWGYGVVYANPRGSGGYGHAFQRANFQDWGQGPAGDVLAALDEAVNLDWADPDRLVLTGGSYGGYLVAWIVGNDDRFRAAVAQRGVYDLRTFHGEGNAWRLLAWEMGGSPWESRMDTVLRRESPITYVPRIRTPLLIMHADRDLRTGVSQSEMLYRALRVLGRPVEYVRYPDSGHDLSRTGDPLRRMDRIARILEFFERFSENRAVPPRG